METQTSAAAGHDCDLPIEREDALEVVQLDVCFGRHIDG